MITWATPCNGYTECIYGSDEKNCNTPIWLLPIISIVVGVVLCITIICCFRKNVAEGIEDIIKLKKSENEENVNPDCPNLKKHFHIAFLVEKRNLTSIKKIFCQEVEVHRDEGTAFCCLKVMVMKPF